MKRIFLSVLVLVVSTTESILSANIPVPFSLENDGLRLAPINYANNGLEELMAKDVDPNKTTDSSNNKSLMLSNKVKFAMLNDNNRNEFWERLFMERPRKKEFFNRDLAGRLAMFDLLDSVNQLFLGPLNTDEVTRAHAPSWPMFKRQLIRPRYTKKHRDILRGLALKRSGTNNYEST